MALELGISVKTLWGWENNRWKPNAKLEAKRSTGINTLSGFSEYLDVVFFNTFV